MSLVKFKNSEDFSLKSPRFLHISQINKLVTSKKEPIRSKSPFITPKKKNVYERDSSKHKIIESPDFDSLYSCELAISAKDFISILRMKEEIKNKEIEKALINNKKYSEFNKKRSYLPKKSRVSQLIPKKFETIHPPSRNSSFSNDSSTIYRENDQYSNIILFDNTSEQSEIVWRYLNNNEIESPEIKSIKTNWVQGLTKEERGPELYHKTIKIYGWHPRILSLQKLENVLKTIKKYNNNSIKF